MSCQSRLEACGIAGIDDPPSIVSSWRGCFDGACGDVSTLRGLSVVCVFQAKGLAYRVLNVVNKMAR